MSKRPNHRSAGLGGAMTTINLSPIPIWKPALNSRRISANLLFSFELGTASRPASSFRIGTSSAIRNPPDLTGIAQKAAPADNLNRSSRKRSVPPRFRKADRPRATCARNIKQEIGWMYDVLPLPTSPLLRIDDSRKKKKTASGPTTCGRFFSPSSFATRRELLVRLIPIQSTLACRRFSIVQNHAHVLRKPSPGPSFSLDNALLQQTSLAVWFFARANRFTNDSAANGPEALELP